MRGFVLLVGAVIAAVLVCAVAIPVISETTDKPASNDDLYVFMLAGQSNAAYYNADVAVVNDEVEGAPADYAFYYGTALKPIDCGVINNMQYDTTLASYDIYSMTDSDGSFTIGNVEAPFASYFVNKTNQKCLIVNTGIGGVSINSYVPGTVGYDYAADVFADALSKIPETFNVKMGGIIWIQGESNASMAIDTYISQFGKMFDGFKADFGLNQVYISETRPINGGNASVAQTIIPDKISGAYLASEAASGFSVSDGTIASLDNLHYTQKGDDILGADLSSFIVHKLGLRTVIEGPEKTLVGIIPLLIVVGLVIAVIGVIYSRME